MENDDYYRRQASHAQGQAEKSISDVDKMAWLRVAQSWMQLIKTSVPSDATVARAQEMAERNFDEKTDARDTHQKRSSESH